MFGVGDDGASDASIFVVVVSSVNAFFFEPVFGSFFSFLSSKMSFGEGSVLKVVFFFFLVVLSPPKGSDVDGDIASRQNFLFRSLCLSLITFDKNLSIAIDRSIDMDSIGTHVVLSNVQLVKRIKGKDDEENSLSPIPHKAKL